MDACKTSAQMRRHLQNPTIVTASQIIFTNTIRPLHFLSALSMTDHSRSISYSYTDTHHSTGFNGSFPIEDDDVGGRAQGEGRRHQGGRQGGLGVGCRVGVGDMV